MFAGLLRFDEGSADEEDVREQGEERKEERQEEENPEREMHAALNVELSCPGLSRSSDEEESRSSPSSSRFDAKYNRSFLHYQISSSTLFSGIRRIPHS